MNEELVKAASAARGNSYAPYSGYRVGAALLSGDGRVFTGCNVENVSYGATICAEQSALAAMIAAGARLWVALVVATKDGAAPCGICRQVLSEFAAQNARVIAVSESGESRETGFRELLPDGFASRAVARQEARTETI